MRAGEKVLLKNQEVRVICCDRCGALMVNIDQKELALGDLDILKKAGLRISNPATNDPICIKCEIQREEEEHTLKRKVNNYMDDDDTSSNDSHFFSGGSSGSFGGGFGGFGGGMFSGGGASGSW
jgi:uncharacterized membrane protein YgcG